MASVSALGFVIITTILFQGSSALLVRRGEGELVKEIQETYNPCMKVYDGCIKRHVDEVYLMPSTNPDGSLYFPKDFFNRVCGYYINGSVCYDLASSEDCEPSFPPNNVIKNLGKLSVILCRNTDALNTLVHCLNDKEFYKAFMRIPDYLDREESDCNFAKEQVRRTLQLFKDRCGKAEYISLKTFLEDFGEDMPLLVFPNSDDKSCNINISTLTPDRRRRGVTSAMIKRMINDWIL